MRIAVLGAAGRTGRLVTDLALAAGHEVTAVVRDPAKLSAPDAVAPRALRVARADVQSPGALQAAVAGQDVVVAALGTSGRAATTVFSDAARELTAVPGLRHVLVMSSAGLDSDHLPLAQRLVTRLVVDRLYREIHRDLARMEAVLAASDLPWTVLRVPMLKDGPAAPAPVTAYDRPLPRAGTATRTTVATWLVTHLADPATLHHRIAIADGGAGD
ncbi:NAD(P)-binding oxidoreductase [Kitasatospora sp. NPDC049285]|uniref:NAD(P)-dependent oxidoreductase n=1 Tax=Kitasatospora sp. NPDC049285 TaxID=3157096 RepID=UPI0034453F0C